MTWGDKFTDTEVDDAFAEFVIEDGERVAQMVISKHEEADWEEVVELVETERGTGGFGSTGVK